MTLISEKRDEELGSRTSSNPKQKPQLWEQQQQPPFTSLFQLLASAAAAAEPPQSIMSSSSSADHHHHHHQYHKNAASAMVAAASSSPSSAPLSSSSAAFYRRSSNSISSVNAAAMNHHSPAEEDEDEEEDDDDDEIHLVTRMNHHSPAAADSSGKASLPRFLQSRSKSGLNAAEGTLYRPAAAAASELGLGLGMMQQTVETSSIPPLQLQQQQHHLFRNATFSYAHLHSPPPLIDLSRSSSSAAAASPFFHHHHHPQQLQHQISGSADLLARHHSYRSSADLEESQEAEEARLQQNSMEIRGLLSSTSASAGMMLGSSSNGGGGNGAAAEEEEDEEEEEEIHGAANSTHKLLWPSNNSSSDRRMNDNHEESSNNHNNWFSAMTAPNSTITEASFNHRKPAIHIQQQESDRILWNTNYSRSSAPNNSFVTENNSNFMQIRHPRPPLHNHHHHHSQTENSSQSSAPNLLYHNGLQQQQQNINQLLLMNHHHDQIRLNNFYPNIGAQLNHSNSAAASPHYNYKGFIQQTSSDLFSAVNSLQHQQGSQMVSNTALLQRLQQNGCNTYSDPFRLDDAGDLQECNNTAVQQSLIAADSAAAAVMSQHPLRNFDVNQSISMDSSQMQLQLDHVQNAEKSAATSDHGSSKKDSPQHDVANDSHSCNVQLQNGLPLTCENTDAKTGKLSMIVSRRLSALRMEMRKGNVQQEQNEEPQPKQKRKKVRCKVLRDKVKKPRGRKKGQRTETNNNSKDAESETKLDADGNLQDVNIIVAETTAAAEEEVEESMATFKKQKNSAAEEKELMMYQEQGHSDVVRFLDHNINAGGGGGGGAREGMILHHQDESSGISAASAGISAAATANNNSFKTDICQLVDYLGLSDEKCHDSVIGEDNLMILSRNVIIPTSTENPHTKLLPPLDLEKQRHDEIVPYEQHPHDKNALPLYLSSAADTSSSTASTELILPHGNLQLANVPLQRNLQLVLYNQKRDMVVSRGMRTYKKIRAKVQLDPESQRVWLQLENGGSPEVDTDPDRVKYWEKERQDMKKRVDFFIHKMHFVQGDRRFSRWKGSIVDSVVGAFLTQNVSDHLSSSAFMSVASRFPPVPKTENVDTCIVDTCASECQKDGNGETIPLQIETGFPGFTKEPYPLRSGLESNDSMVMDESTVNEVENSGITDSCKQTENEKTRNCESPGQIRTGYASSHYENLTSTPDQQSCGILKRQNTLLSSDDERNSICSFDLGDGENRIEDVSEAFRKSSPSRNTKVRRMLHFDNADKQESMSCSILETNKHVGFSIVHETEVASDNSSDQQSESESVIGSSSSVQSLQDSNYNLQLTTTQDLNYHAEIVQANSRELDVPQVDKNSKKRPLSVSSMSGIERAQLEANQKGRKKNHHRDWESVRREVLGIPASAKNNTAERRPRPPDHEDSVNWDAVRLAELGELAETIKERGMHHVLSGRIKAFITSLYEDHGTIDLEWLRNLSTEMAREYLMSVHGLGVKSVECIRLLTLHHLAFPVDTNVGRICVRLGWVPIEPLPEEVQLHLVELYPIQETIQKYLWPRLCTLDQRTLYELHYQLITFGKVFCTKSKPNCNACPLRTECKHFASAYASAKPLLTGPKENKTSAICSGASNEKFPALSMDGGTALLDYPQEKSIQFTWPQEAPLVSEIETGMPTPFDQHRPSVASYSENFYVEMPASPEQTYEDDLMDIEEIGANMYIYKNYNDYSLDLIGDNISVDQSLITMNDELTSQEVRTSHPSTLPRTATFNLPPNLPKINNFSPHRCCNDEITSTSQIPSCESKCSTSSDVACTPTHQTDIVEISENAIVAVPEAAQIPAPKLKNIGRLRTIHYVYELPDDHCLLKSVDPREKDDPCSYLLAIWSPGETPGSQQDIDECCRDEFSVQSGSCSSGADETVAGTLLIPCRTAMHGNFPLNGTYFQVNEVFADHESSVNPIQVPRSLLWCLRRRFVYFGTSVPNIFKGLSTDEIKDCFWRGFVCVRGFDRHSRAPKPLVCRLHFPISKQPQKANKQQRKKTMRNEE